MTTSASEAPRTRDDNVALNLPHHCDAHGGCHESVPPPSPSVAHKRNELEKRASHHSGQFGQQPLFPRREARQVLLVTQPRKGKKRGRRGRGKDGRSVGRSVEVKGKKERLGRTTTATS